MELKAPEQELSRFRARVAAAAVFVLTGVLTIAHAGSL